MTDNAIRPGYDPRIKKYYELLEEVEEKEKKIKFLQTEINRLNEALGMAYWQQDYDRNFGLF